MGDLDLDELARLEREATPGPWVVQDGCSWRRIGAAADGDVLCPTTHPRDGHPDLDGRNRAADLAFIVAARAAVPALLARVRELESSAKTSAEIACHLCWLETAQRAPHPEFRPSLGFCRLENEGEPIGLVTAFCKDHWAEIRRLGFVRSPA